MASVIPAQRRWEQESTKRNHKSKYKTKNVQTALYELNLLCADNVREDIANWETFVARLEAVVTNMILLCAMCQATDEKSIDQSRKAFVDQAPNMAPNPNHGAEGICFEGFTLPADPKR